MDAEFGRVAAVAANKRGLSLVADAIYHRILVFDPAGNELQKVGQKGSGPGEFEQLGDLAISPAGDTAMALDLNNQRVAVYHLGDTLTFARTFSVSAPLASSGFAYRIFLPQVGGPILAYKSVSTSTFGEAGRINVLHFTEGGMENADSVLSAPADEVLFSTVGGRSITLMPFGGRTLLALGRDDKFYQVWTSSSTVVVQPLDGSPRRLVELPVTRPPPPVTPSALRELLASYPEDGTARSIVNDALQRGAIPEVLPAIRQLLIDEVGAMWLDLHRPSDRLVAVPFGLEYQDSQYEPRPWLILDPEGDVLEALVPPNARLFGFGDTFAIGVMRDSLDVERVVRFRIVRSSGN